MKKNSVLSITLSFLIATLFSNSVFAGDLEWSGVYRFEGYHIKNSELGSRGRELSYGLHHLVLRPKIVAGDGLTIYGQFDILNEANDYANSQMGQIWGSGVRGATAQNSTGSADDSNSLSERQRSETLEVTQLYLTHTQEYGALLVGRAPLQFGLGMNYNAGRGLFDHWFDTRDMVAYKVVFGNMFLMPMFGKPSEGNINNTDDVNDYMLHFQYENPETDLELGVFYHIRRASSQGSDAPIGGAANEADLGDNLNGDVNAKTISVYALRDSETLRLGLEASFQSGDTGVKTAAGDNVTWGGFGIAGELELRPQGSKWMWGLKAGTATGDDPATDAKFEGFFFDRNYDVAMMMFNRPLGQDDFFRTKAITGNVWNDPAEKFINKADVETISNVMYLAPSARYKFNDRWSLNNTVITGWLADSPILNRDVAKDLGYEWDISVEFSPRKGITWINQAGLLFPGAAWEGDNQYDNSFAFGLATKAAISF